MGASRDDKRCGFFTLIWISAFTMSLALIIVGSMNQFQWNDYHNHFDSTCTMEPRIPVYMMVAGSINIVYLLLRIILQVFSRYCTFILRQPEHD